MAENGLGRTTAYEWKAVTLLALGFGLVGLDRWLIAPLIPSIARDLNLTDQDVGNVVGMLGLSWGVFAIFVGNLADSIGRRWVVIPSLLIFSVMCGLTGAVGAVGAMLLIRAVMGATEGAYIASSLAATDDASAPKRRGMNQGIMLSTFALLGLGVGPILAPLVEEATNSWRTIFFFAAIPGALVALLMFFVLKEPRQLGLPAQDKPKAAGLGALRAIAISAVLVTAGYFVLQSKSIELIGGVFGAALIVAFIAGKMWLKSNNILVAMASLVCAMSCIFVLGALYPNYLQRYLHVSPVQAGLVTSALGFGGFVGQTVVSAISDYVGRKITSLVSFIGAAASVYWLIQVGDNFAATHAQAFVEGGPPIDLGGQFWLFFGILFLVALFTFAILAIMTGPVATEAVSPTMIASAVGICSGTGEIFGAGVGPPIAGFVSQQYGIQNILYVGLIGVVIGIFVVLFLRETAPRKLAGSGAISPPA